MVMNNQLIDQFIDFYWLTTGASQNTLSAYRSDLNIFSKWLKDIPFEMLIDTWLMNISHIEKTLT